MICKASRESLLELFRDLDERELRLLMAAVGTYEKAPGKFGEVVAPTQREIRRRCQAIRRLHRIRAEYQGRGGRHSERFADGTAHWTLPSVRMEHELAGCVPPESEWAALGEGWEYGGGDWMKRGK